MPKQKQPLTIPEIIEEIKKYGLETQLEIQSQLNKIISDAEMDAKAKLQLIQDSKK